MCKWKERSQGSSKWYIAEIAVENIKIYLYPSRYAKGWDITVYEFDDEIGFVFMKEDSEDMSVVFAHAEKMVTDFMTIEIHKWERRRREWIGE